MILLTEAFRVFPQSFQENFNIVPLRNLSNSVFSIIHSFDVMCSELRQHRYPFKVQCSNMLNSAFCPESVIVFRKVVTVHTGCSLNSSNRLVSVEMYCTVFPMRYETNAYRLCRIHRVIKDLNNLQTIKEYTFPMI